MFTFCAGNDGLPGLAGEEGNPGYPGEPGIPGEKGNFDYNLHRLPFLFNETKM